MATRYVHDVTNQTDKVIEIRRGSPYIWEGTGWSGQISKFDSYLYAGSVDSYLYCINAYTGKIKWKYKAGYSIKSSVCIYKDKVIFGSRDHCIHCVNRINGKLIWKEIYLNQMGMRKFPIDIKDQAKGIYFLRVTTKSGSFTKQLIIQ